MPNQAAYTKRAGFRHGNGGVLGMNPPIPGLADEVRGNPSCVPVLSFENHGQTGSRMSPNLELERVCGAA